MVYYYRNFYAICPTNIYISRYYIDIIFIKHYIWNCYEKAHWFGRFNCSMNSSPINYCLFIRFWLVSFFWNLEKLFSDTHLKKIQPRLWHKVETFQFTNQLDEWWGLTYVSCNFRRATNTRQEFIYIMLWKYFLKIEIPVTEVYL